jgi:predicted HicB family RNase H-like nuclease
MMEHKGYIGKVEFDPDARIFHGEVVGIRDVVTFQGESVAELEKAFKDSVDDYLAFCRERGEKPDKPCSGQFVVRIPPELHRRVNMLAGASGKSLNAWVAEHLDKETAAEMRTVKLVKSKAAAGPKGRRRSKKTATA